MYRSSSEILGVREQRRGRGLGAYTAAARRPSVDRVGRRGHRLLAHDDRAGHDVADAAPARRHRGGHDADEVREAGLHVDDAHEVARGRGGERDPVPALAARRAGAAAACRASGRRAAPRTARSSPTGSTNCATTTTAYIHCSDLRMPTPTRAPVRTPRPDTTASSAATQISVSTSAAAARDPTPATVYDSTTCSGVSTSTRLSSTGCGASGARDAAGRAVMPPMYDPARAAGRGRRSRAARPRPTHSSRAPAPTSHG